MAIHLIMLMCILNHSAFAGSRVAVSLYALELGANQVMVGALMALYALCPMLFAVSIGKLTDRIGPRLPMLMGTLGVTTALLLPPLFPGLVTLYFSSLLAGTSFHFFFITVSSITGGIGGAENRVRNYTMISLAFSGAAFVGPMTVGFSIDHLGHLSSFLMLASFTLVPILLLWFKTGFLPPVVKHHGEGGKRNIRDLWRIPALRNTFIASGFFAAAHDLFGFYMPVYGHTIGLSASVIGTVIGVCALAGFIIRFVLPTLTKRLSEFDILTYAIFESACAFILFPFFQNPFALAAVAFLLGLGLGCGMPLSMSLIYLLAPAERVAESTGLRVTINNFAHLVIPLVFGSLGMAFGFFPVFFSNSAMLAAGGFLMRRNKPAIPG